MFEQGHQFLREKEQYLLEWLEGTEQQLTEGRNSHVTKGSEEVIRLETLISELEKKAQQPALELLQVRDQLNCTSCSKLQSGPSMSMRFGPGVRRDKVLFSFVEFLTG